MSGNAHSVEASEEAGSYQCCDGISASKARQGCYFFIEAKFFIVVAQCGNRLKFVTSIAVSGSESALTGCLEYSTASICEGAIA